MCIWNDNGNEYVYYDRRLDTQGIVPGCAIEEAENDFRELCSKEYIPSSIEN